ncbi:type VI secretion system baseplate subunit TssF [Yersinia mollaretii]|uniref:type VI secretion system baseplate subunit TssF n=1 Tax=Yersinia mollaretii TaxID=33060 RepID=UPI0005DEAEC4|nr:type VI secretion system baseplate subunit TssF [Yersinia mollaretii]CND99682.1 protein ImpG/VasA [Yersinia mollaretii]
MYENKFLSYYQKELTHLKKYGAAFSRQFPKIARRLGMSDGLSEDPHVERIIESFALLTAQIQQRLDEDMPEVTDALLTVLAPHLLRQFPSVCIIQMLPDIKSSAMTAKNLIKSGTELFSKPVNSQVCRFRTLYPVMLLPMTLQKTQLTLNEDDMSWQLELGFTVWPGAVVEADRIRLYINGSISIVNVLYSLLCSELKSLSFAANGTWYQLAPEDIQAVGFAFGEGLLDRDSSISPAHTLLQDYFFFPQKFHFIDLPLPPNFVASSNSELTYRLVFNHCQTARLLNNIASIIDTDVFRLNCTPAINLFEQRAEPITPHHEMAEYAVKPDVRYKSSMEVWSIDNVYALRKQGNDIVSRPIYPLFGLDHSRSDGEAGIFLQAIQRKWVDEQDAAHSWFIAFCDRSEQPLEPESDMVSISLTCTNGDLATYLLNGDPAGDFESELPLSGVKIQALTRPSAPLRPPIKQAARWRLISQLSLNHMLLNGTRGCRVLKETLALYNFNNSPTNERLINLIDRIEVTPVTARLVANDPRSMARGVQVRITFTDAAGDEPGYFLLCRFLDHFLALYAPVNSFSRVVTSIGSQEESLRQWPIRAGRLAWM